MVADTRSARKIKTEADEHSSASVRQEGLRRSARGTPSARMPLPATPSKSKSQRVEKLVTPTPRRRSERGDNPMNNDPRPPVEERSPLNSKRKKEKTVIQVTMESKNAATDSEEGSSKRKRMTARSYIALFRRQSLKRPDAVVELEQAGQPLHVSSHNGHETDLLSKSDEECTDKVLSGEVNLCRGREECTDKVLSGAHPEFIIDSNDRFPNTCSENIHVDTHILDSSAGRTLDGNSLVVSYDPSTPGEKRNDSNNCGEKILGYSREECINKATNGIIPKLNSDPKDRFPEKPNDSINLDPNLLDTDSNGILDASSNPSAQRETSNDSNNCGEMILGSAREECSDETSSGALTESGIGPKDHLSAIPSVDVNLDTNHFDTVVDEALDVDGMARSCNPSMQGLLSPRNGDKEMHQGEAISDGGIINLRHTCSPCSENERLGVDLPNQEHNMSGQVRKEDVGCIPTIKDSCDTSAACIADGEDNQRNVHASCNRDGELHCCNGKWQCTVCVKKKALHEQHSKFVEYWVPAQLSNYQLELYCSSLLSNSLYLCSSSKNEPFGVLREILFTLRKSCDHPYLLHSSIQGQLFTDKRSAGEILDAGIKASGKLLLLDMMLSEIQTRGLKVLVLYQLTVGLTSLGSILEDFLRQKFGQNTYEHVDFGVVPSKKQAAVSRFNKKDDGQFVFLLETRACSSSIKSLELDLIITYNSDWNPANDLRTLQKIRIDSTAEQIKVFRLYSSCTVEEQALLLSRRNLNIDSSFQTKNRATLDSLLGWGAFYLFGKLDEHLSNKATCKSDLSFGALLPNEVIEEFQAIISGDKGSCSNSCISKAQMGDGRYITTIPLHGETKCHLKDKKEPHIFWTNLLNREIPRWKYMTGLSPRNRKRVRYFDTSTDESGREDNAPKQRKKVVDEVTQNDVSDGGSSTSQRDGDKGKYNQNNISDGNSFSTEALAEERVVSLDEQKSLQLLQLETNKLCQILNLSEETALATGRFLEYVSKNHRTHSDLPAIMHALQISLCWVGASISGQKIDKRESLVSAKRILDYQCTEEQLNFVYWKMRSLKRDYMRCSKNDNNAEGHILSQPEQTQNVKAAWRETNGKIKETRKRCLKRMEKLVQKQQKESDELSRIWEEKKRNLDRDYKLESVFIRSIHGQGSMRAEKLKILDDNFAKKIEEHNLHKNVDLKNLEAKQLAARNEEQKKTDILLAELESSLNELKSVNGPQFGSESEEDAGLSQSSRPHIPTIGPELSGHLESHNESRSLSTRMDYINASTEAHSNDSPPKTSSNFPSEQLCTDKDSEYLVKIPVYGPNEVVAPVQPVESVQAAVLPDCTDLPPQQVLRDEVREDFVPAELQNQDLSTLETNNTSPAPCSTSGIVENMNTVPPNFPLPTNDTYVAESSEQMHNVAADVTGHQSPVAEVEQQNFDQSELQNHDDQGRTSEQMPDVPVDVSSRRSPVAEIEQQNFNQDEQQNHNDQGTSLPTLEPDLIEIIVQDPTSQRVENLGIHGSEHPVVESERRGQLAQDIQPSSSSPLISAAAPRAVESTFGSQNQNIHLSDINAGYFQGQINSFLAPFPPQVNYPHLGRPNVPDPLQHALEQMQKEAESMKKKLEEKVAELQSERDMMIQEIIRQYSQKQREVEVEYNLKKSEHNAIMEKFRLNKMLAEAFRYKCLDPPRPSPGIPRLPRRGLRQLHQPTVQPLTGHHPRAPPQQQPQQYMVRPSPTLHQNLEPPPARRPQPPPPLVRPHVPSPPSRPPVIGSIPRPSNIPRAAGEVRARAPHLQSSDRSNGSSSATITPPVITSQASQIRFPPPPPPSTTTGPSFPVQRVIFGNGLSARQSFGSSSLPNIPTVLPPAGLSAGNSGGSKQMPREGGGSVVFLSDDE